MDLSQANAPPYKKGSSPFYIDEPDFLLRLCRQDPKAQTDLIKEIAPYLKSIALRYLKDGAAADDVLQDALVNGLRKIEQFSGDGPIRAWFRRIVINAALMRIRSEKRRAEDLVDPTSDDFDAYGTRLEMPWARMKSAEDILSEKDMAQLIRQKIDELPEQYRIVLLLRDIEEMSTRQVAEQLDLTEGAVKVRLHRARGALKKLMEPLLRGTA